ncbi:S66 peptidase family protein [Natribacillus halophilus]|uniref:Muramoyltetrapeptide carboxypeptidase n=1 Tax=Natribacillus halophilus TaxID=549003 RepID=A0A1G8KW77_9BACI|nr:LD-carboxypeptidase [Natribacillus halophilus]SDI47661.1 muramoyltetrapeptide carboxypeptidase [Natribacillus halophilus]
MKKIKSRALRPGHTLGLAMPASPVKKEALDKAIAVIENLGFHTQLARRFEKNNPHFLAGDISSRVGELHQLFVDPEVDGILCLRGGYGTPGLLPHLDYSLIAKHPKLLIGYSDITALHIALQQNSKMITLHGPMAATDLLEAPPFTVEHFLQSLRAESWPQRLVNPEHYPMKTLVHGMATGILTGGNLSVLVGLMGTPFEIDTRGKVLFLEDVGEEPYRVDRALTQLALAGKLDEAAGFILGTCKDCTSTAYPQGENVLAVCERILAPYGKPTIYNVQAGHGDFQLTLPLGAGTRVDATNKHIDILESVVI